MNDSPILWDMLPGYCPPCPPGISPKLWLAAYLESWKIAMRTKTSEEARKQGAKWASKHGARND